MPIVVNSGCLENMNAKEKELQERWFEIYTSELFYLKSLQILKDVVLKNLKKSSKLKILI